MPANPVSPFRSEATRRAEIRYPVPPAAGDCHMHVFGPPDRYPGISGHSYAPREALLSAWRSMANCIGLQRVVAVQLSCYGTDNACLVAVLHELGGCARGVAVIAATTPLSALQALHDAGVRATKVDRSLAIREIINKRYFADIKTHVAAPRRIFKHLKKEHADSLCERGELGLGPLNYYTTIENKNIADEHEGLFLTYAEGARHSIASVSGGGNHVLVYCTTTDLNAQFGYDACVEISQPELFARAIASAVVQHFKGRNELVRAEHTKCVYQHTRIISGRLHGFSEALIQLGELSVDTIDVLSDKKYLIKESSYRKDSEYRFAFVMRTDVPEYTVIKCPEATKFCRRITIARTARMLGHPNRGPER
jgi:Amidohydrolase